MDSCAEQLHAGIRYNYLRQGYIRSLGLAEAWINHKSGEEIKMSEFEKEVEKAEQELEQSLIQLDPVEEKEDLDDEYLGDLKMQAQEYQQKLQDAAEKAKDFATEKFSQAGDKLKELQDKNPQEIVEDVKDYARRKPAQTILISAAVGLFVGLLFRNRK